MLKEEEQVKIIEKDLIQELFEAGFQYGYSRSRLHPLIRPFIFGIREQTTIIDLEQSVQQLKRAADFLEEIVSKGGQVLWVGNKPEARLLVKKTAMATEMPFVAQKWIGGTITNFNEIRKRVNRLLEIKTEEQKGGLAKYTKKERSLIAKEKKDLEKYFSGIIKMEKKPKVLVLIDSEGEEIAAKEAQITEIPLISLSNTDSAIKKIDYPVIGNDYNRKSIAIFLKYLEEAVNRGRQKLNDQTKETIINN